MPERKNRFNNARELVEFALDLRFFHPEDGAPAVIPYRYVPGEGPLIVVVGPNAGGKSFFRRLLREICSADDPKVECIHLSMEGRNNSMGGIAPLIYGDEETSSTGFNSINTVLMGIKTCRGRTSPHAIIWDEPDVGLSEGNAASVGRAIAEFSRTASELTKAVVVITHRKALVAELAPLAPHYVHLGDPTPPPDLAAWLAAPPVVRPLEDLLEEHRGRFQAILRVLRS